MKILVTAKHITGAAYEGGSGRYMICLINALKRLGHDVIATTTPKNLLYEKYDLIIVSHHLKDVKDHPAYKICISHGLINDELFSQGANRYISISEEVRSHHQERGFLSEVLSQPIDIVSPILSNDTLRNILIIRNKPIKTDPFKFLSDRYNVRYSDINIPIEQQIYWADLCITLGRGALESMIRGKPVLIADNRDYIGPYGDGYLTPFNIEEIAKCNFSGRRFKNVLIPEWIESELAKYDPRDSEFLHDYVAEYHDSNKIAKKLIQKEKKYKFGFGALINDRLRLDTVLRQSEISGRIYTITEPDRATSGLNKLLKMMRLEGCDIGVLTHQDMYYRNGWIDCVINQIEKLPKNWIIAGIIGKDERGEICGKFHDMRMPLHFNSDHSFPVKASCLDECCIIVNLKSKFNFDENLEGFDLYGTLSVLQAQEMGGSAWILNAFAEHYCMRSFKWHPDKDFEKNLKWIYQRFPNAERIDSTVFGQS